MDHAEHGHQHGHGHANDQGMAAIARYLRHAPRMWRSEINDAVVDLVAPVPGERVVDVGAGMGPGAVRAAATGAEVIAVEPTPFMRRILTVRRWFQRHRRNITVLAGAAERLPVADRSVDALWAVNTMHHWVDVGRGVEEIGRVLRPGGRIVLVDEDFDDPRHPEFERFRDRHDHHGGASDDDHDDRDHDDSGGGRQHHGFTMVEAAQMAEAFTAAGLVAIEAENRLLIGRPVIAVTATAAG